MEHEKGIGPIHLVPVATATGISAALGWLLESSHILSELETPFSRSQTLEATVYNVSLFALLLGLGALSLYLLVKLKKAPLLKIVILVSLAISMVGIVEVYAIALFSISGILEILPPDTSLLLSIASSLLATYLVATSDNEAVLSSILILYGSSAGSLLGVLLPLWTVVLAAILASAYDLYSVFKGPLKHLIELERSRIATRAPEALSAHSSESLLKGAVIPFRGLYIGIGDVIFYSMIASTALLRPSLSFLRALVVASSLSIGAYVTFKLVERRGALPALPLPALMSVSTYLVALVLETALSRL